MPALVLTAPVADVDVDGRPDLIVANRSSNPAAPRPSFVCRIATTSAPANPAAVRSGAGGADINTSSNNVIWGDVQLGGVVTATTAATLLAVTLTGGRSAVRSGGQRRSRASTLAPKASTSSGAHDATCSLRRSPRTTGRCRKT